MLQSENTAINRIRCKIGGTQYAHFDIEFDVVINKTGNYVVWSWNGALRHMYCTGKLPTAQEGSSRLTPLAPLNINFSFMSNGRREEEINLKLRRGTEFVKDNEAARRRHVHAGATTAPKETDFLNGTEGEEARQPHTGFEVIFKPSCASSWRNMVHGTPATRTKGMSALELVFFGAAALCILISVINGLAL